MAENTIKENVLSDEQIKKDNERFKELVSKPANEITEEEKKELEELKENYGKRAQERISKEVSEKYAFKAEFEKEKQERLRLQQENEELKKRGSGFSDALKESYVEINGKKWLTDDALVTKINTGEITEAEAYAYQRKRDKEETIVRVKEDLRKEEEIRQEQSLRLQDAQSVIKEYPHFAKFLPDGSLNPNFKPENSLYKLTNELYLEGYNKMPDGLSKAVKRAKQILRISDTNIDRSNELNIENITLPPEGQRREQDITLSEDEKTTAVNMFCRGDIINPKTKRPYTENEAYIIALEAKKSRIRK